MTQQTPTQIAGNARSRRFHEHIAEMAAELNRQNQLGEESEKIVPALSYNDRLSALESEIRALKKIVARQVQMIIKVDEANKGTSARLITPPKIAEIIDVVCDFYGLTRTQIIGQQRTANFTRPRHIVCYFARKLTLHSLPEIGAALGDRDHTTIMHGDRKIKKEVQFNPVLKEDIDILELKIEEKILNRDTPHGQQVVHKLPVP